jgi:ethanolamine transporter EutH
MPHWWRHFSPNAAAAVMTWFTLLNAGGAILAAIPVAFGVVLGTKTRQVALGLIIGLMPALYLAVSGCIEYGVPSNLEALVVDISQFVAVSLAVVGVLALIRGFPLTIGSSDRGSRLQ